MQSQTLIQAGKKENDNKPNLTPGAFSLISNSRNNNNVKTPPKNNWHKKPDIFQRQTIQNSKSGIASTQRQNTQNNEVYTTQATQPDKNIDKDLEIAYYQQNTGVLRQSFEQNKNIQKSLDGFYINNYIQNKLLPGSSKERSNQSKEKTNSINDNNYTYKSQNLNQKSPKSIQKNKNGTIISNSQSLSNRSQRNNHNQKEINQQFLENNMSINTNSNEQNINNYKKEVSSTNKRYQRSSSICNNERSNIQNKSKLLRSNSSNINSSQSSNKLNCEWYTQKEEHIDQKYLNQMKQKVFNQVDSKLDNELYNNKLQVDIIENILNKEEQYYNWRSENMIMKDTLKNLVNELNDYKKKYNDIEKQNNQLEQNINQNKQNYQVELIKFSEQIQKFKNIQNMYLNEKQISERMEKELILKDQELCDAKNKLKNIIIFLLEQRDTLLMSNEEVRNENNSNFSFEDKLEGVSNQSKLVLKQIEKYISSLQTQISELKITYTSKITNNINPDISRQIIPQLNQKDSLKQESQIIQKSNQQHQNISESNYGMKKSESKKIFTKNNSFQTQMQKQILNINGHSNNNQIQISYVQEKQHENQLLGHNKQFQTQNSEQIHGDKVYIPSFNRINAFANSKENDQSQQTAQQSQTSTQMFQSLNTIQSKDEFFDKCKIKSMSQLSNQQESKDIKIQNKNYGFEQNKINLLVNNHDEADKNRLFNKQSENMYEFNETFQKTNDANILNNETLTFDFENNPNNFSTEEAENNQILNQDKRDAEEKQNEKGWKYFFHKNQNGMRNGSIGSEEYSHFKKNLEDIINNDSMQNAVFNSQQLENSAANPIKINNNNKIQTHQQSISDFEIAAVIENGGLLDNVNKIPKQPFEDIANNKLFQKNHEVSLSESEQESRCQSLSTKIFKDKPNIQNMNRQQSKMSLENEISNQKEISIKKEFSVQRELSIKKESSIKEEKSILKPTLYNQNSYKKPPIDFKDKENKCPNNNNNNEGILKENKSNLQNKNLNNESKYQSETKLGSSNKIQSETKVLRSSEKQDEENKFVVSKFEYNAQKDSDLSFKQGEMIQVLKETKNGWWIGMHNNKIGYFPFNFVEEIKPQ